MRNPWVGLRPFWVDEAGLFFGRDREVQILGNLVATMPTLILYAPSGTGKSSLINAGLMPVLRADPGQVPVLVRDPHDDVVERTREALAAAGWDPPRELDLVAMLEQHWLDTDRRAVIVIDQFEERFNAGSPVEELFATMSKLAHSHGDSACIMLSLREDYLGSLEPLMRRVPGLLNSSYRVPPLSRAALEEAVYGPLREVGAEGAVQPDLVARVLDDLDEGLSGRQDAGEQRFEPGYFQIVWSTLWREFEEGRADALDLNSYKRLRGAKRILKDFTSKVLATLEPAQTSIFWSISRYLVLPTGAKVALTVEDLVNLLQPSEFFVPSTSSTRTTSSDASPWLSGLPAPELVVLIRGVLQRLTASDAPIFQRVMRLNREEFEVLHDLLGRIILDWREEYPRMQTAAADEFAASLEAAARRQGWGVRGLRDDAKRAADRIAAEIPKVARALHKQLKQDITHSNIDSIVAQVHLMLTFRSVANSYSFSGEIGYSESADIVENWKKVMEDPVREMIGLALKHQSESVREEFQELLIRVDMPSDRMKFGKRTPWFTIAQNTLVAGSVATGSVGIAYILFDTAIESLRIQYPFLTIAHVLVLLLLVYALVFSEAKGSLRSRIVEVVVPFVKTRKPARLLATWPLPTTMIMAVGVGFAWVFNWLTWSATAGSTMGILLATVGVAFAWIAAL